MPSGVPACIPKGCSTPALPSAGRPGYTLKLLLKRRGFFYFQDLRRRRSLSRWSVADIGNSGPTFGRQAWIHSEAPSEKKGLFLFSGSPAEEKFIPMERSGYRELRLYLR